MNEHHRNSGPFYATFDEGAIINANDISIKVKKHMTNFSSILRDLSFPQVK